MYKIIVFIFGLCIFTVSANEGTPSNSNASSNNAILKLNSILEEMMPLVFDTNQYHKTNTKALVQKDVAELLALVKNTPELPYKKPNSFQTSYSTIVEQLEQTQIAFEQKNYFKAGEILKATTFLLMGNPEAAMPALKINREQFSCDFAFAEYSYAIRDYQNAIIYYDKYLTATHSKPKTNTKLVLERLLSLYTQIDRDPQLTATYLKEYMPYLSNDRELKTLLQEWILSLDNINDYFDDELQSNQFLSFAALQNYATSLLFNNTSQDSQSLSEADKVKFIVLRGMLFNYLNETSASAKEKPIVLYWLAICNKKLNDRSYYTFTSMLLKECFSKYPNHSYAPLCKGEYDQLIQSAWLNPTEAN